MTRLLVLWAGLQALADPPAVLYGGPAPSEAAASASQRTIGRQLPTDWFLAPFEPAVPDAYLLGAAAFTPCADAPVPAERVRALATEGRRLLDEILPDEANAPYAEAAALLPCLAEPLDPEELAQLEFHRAIAVLTRRSGTRAENKAAGLQAFATATAADEDIAWNEDYSSYPRSVFFESKVALLTAPRARLWVLKDGGTRLWIEGREVPPGAGGVDLLAGAHLVHLQRGEQRWSGLLELAPGAEVLVGDADAAWRTLVGNGGDVDRALALRRALLAAWAGPLVVVRSDAFAHLDPDGTLRPWSTDGAYRPRLTLQLGGRWLYLDRNVRVPRLDIPLPSDQWAMPALAVGLKFHPALSAHLEGALALSGPFESAGLTLWRLMGATRLGLAIETPRGVLRPGAVLDAVGLLPGQMEVAGERRAILLLGPMVSGTLALRLTEHLYLQLDAGGGWVGSGAARAGLSTQARFPPARRRLDLD